MTADTLTHTGSMESAPGWPTKNSPHQARLTADGRLQSWELVLAAARGVTGEDRRTASAWTWLHRALRTYLVDRGRNPDNFALIVATSNQAVRAAENRLGALD